MDENNYIELIEKLFSKFNFILTGGPDSADLNNKIQNELDKRGVIIFNMTAKLNLKESICFMKKFDLFLTADCGPMHFALMMRTPTLALFGPVNPNYRLPYDFKKKAKYDYLWYLDYASGSEYDYESEHMEDEMVGLRSISVDDVEKKILKFFKDGRF